MRSANFFLLLGPSGVGKTTLIKMLRTEYPAIRYQPSYTTRSKREGEEEGVQYHFISRLDFEEMNRKGLFIETDQPHGGDFYAIAKEPLLTDLSKGISYVKEVAIKGLNHLKNTDIGDFIIPIYIGPESFDELKVRLIHRDKEKAASRIKTLEEEVRAQEYCNEAVVVRHNDVNHGLFQLKEIIKKYI